MLTRITAWMYTTDVGLIYLFAIVLMLCTESRIRHANKSHKNKQLFGAIFHLLWATVDLGLSIWFIIVWAHRVF